MAKQNKAKKPSNLGKGKVTPVQIAFIVERFLADNNYTNTVSAFRTEASDLFSKTKGKEVPKGLLGLGDILDEYICLKEQRMMVDQEKRRVEMAFQGLQDVIRAYHSGGSISLPPSPPLLPPQVVATPNVPFLPTPNPSNGSPPGHMMHGFSVMNHAQPLMLPPKVAEPNNFSTPVANSSSADKRKASKSAPKVHPPKKCRTQSSTDSHTIGGITLSAQVPPTNNTEDNIVNSLAVQSTSTSSIIRSRVQGSSVAKSLFKQPTEFRANSSSPKTPPQALPSQNDKFVSPLEKSSLDAIGASNSQMIASSSCSVISSEKVIISPLKRKGYYAVERSYCVSSSPLKSNSEKMSKREHVKGRLDFDESFVPMSSEEPVTTDSSPTTDGETQGCFDFDLPDFDFFNGDLSRFLVDMDIECEGILSCQQSSAPADFIPGSAQNVGNGSLETNQALPDSCLSTVTGIISQKDMDIQGPDTMTSVRSITKCIQISSPYKASRNCSLEQTDSPAKS